MNNLRTGFAAALVACSFIFLPHGSLAQAGELACTHSLAQYNEAIRQFEAEAAKANALAQRDPLYASDVAYYELGAERRAAVREELSPVVSASR